MRLLFELFWSFFKIGFFTFGGGYAMIALIQNQVMKRKWVEETEFFDLLILAQSAPGPIALNIAVFIGYKVRGLKGAIATLLGVVIPSFMIILTIAILFKDFRHNPFVDAAFKGMRPAVVALILVPMISLARKMNKWILPVIIGVAVAIWKLEWSPVWMLAAGAAISLAWVRYTITKNVKK